MRSNPYKRLAALPARLARQAGKAMEELQDPANFAELVRIASLDNDEMRDLIHDDFVEILKDARWIFPLQTSRGGSLAIPTLFAELRRPNLRWDTAVSFAKLLLKEIEDVLTSFERAGRHIRAKWPEEFPQGLMGPPNRQTENWQDYFVGYMDAETYLVPVLSEVTRGIENLQIVQRYADNLINVRKRAERDYYAYNWDRSEKGDMWPENLDSVETMYHATTAYRAILAEGFKTREQLESTGALGLGGAVRGISFTASLEIAREIKYGIEALRDFMRGPRTAAWLRDWGRKHGMTDEVWEEASKGDESSYGKIKDPEARLDPNRAMALFKRVMSTLDWHGLVYDPLFFMVRHPERFGDLDERDIGIIEAKVDTAAPGLMHLSAMEEWRVPIPAIIEYKGIT